MKYRGIVLQTNGIGLRMILYGVSLRIIESKPMVT